MLLTILRGAAELYTPKEVNIYILEFSSLFLKNFEDLPHVGGVVTLQESERIKNLFCMLTEQVELRRKRFMTMGIDSLSAYRESGTHDLPQILLLVDDLAAAKAYFPMRRIDPGKLICVRAPQL